MEFGGGVREERIIALIRDSAWLACLVWRWFVFAFSRWFVDLLSGRTQALFFDLYGCILFFLFGLHGTRGM
ncbi:hypothetical protein BX600DRAFT_465194, partial [Xylariales sp. PMI_506]